MILKLRWKFGIEREDNIMKKERLTKRLALFTALTLTGAMLAGCGNTDAAESSSDAQTGVTADTQAAAGDTDIFFFMIARKKLAESQNALSAFTSEQRRCSVTFA